MNYYKIYKQFIDDRKTHKTQSSYYEIHHILPRALGGKDDIINLVKLTAREHYFAHMLLAKIYNSYVEKRQPSLEVAMNRHENILQISQKYLVLQLS